MDNLHKVSTTLIKNYDKIFLEDLNVKGMIKNHKLARSISDVSWGKFVELLTYKASWNDKQIIKINRFFPSSKSCSNCDYINQNLNLSIRHWECPCCKTLHDRDHNAAKNTLKEGYKILSLGTNDYRRGDEIRPSFEGTIYETSKVLG